MKSTLLEQYSTGWNMIEESLMLKQRGDIKGAKKKREEGCAILSTCESKFSTKDGMDSLMYGDNLNFGAIYKTIEESLDTLYAKDQKSLAKIIKLLKENKVLKAELSVYSAYSRPKNIENAEEYVNETVNVLPSFSKKQLKDNNKILLNAIRESNVHVKNPELTKEDEELFEAIEYSLTHKLDLSNIQKYSNVKKILKENVSERNTKTVIEKDINEMFQAGADEIAEKYENLMNNEEKRLAKKIINDPKSTFLESKDSVISLVLEKMDAEPEKKESWNSILNEVESMKEDDKDIVENITKLYKIKSVIGE